MQTLGDWGKDYNQCVEDLMIIENIAKDNGDYTYSEFTNLFNNACKQFGVDEMSLYGEMLGRYFNGRS